MSHKRKKTFMQGVCQRLLFGTKLFIYGLSDYGAASPSRARPLCTGFQQLEMDSLARKTFSQEQH